MIGLWVERLEFGAGAVAYIPMLCRTALLCTEDGRYCILVVVL